MFKPWCLAIWVKVCNWCLYPRPINGRIFMANIWSMLKAKMWFAGIRTCSLYRCCSSERKIVNCYPWKKLCRRFIPSYVTCDCNENHYKDIQDIEFTVQRANICCKPAAVSGRLMAALKMAVDMVCEKLITKRRCDFAFGCCFSWPVVTPMLDPKAGAWCDRKRITCIALVRADRCRILADEAERRANSGEDVILVRIETSPEDIHGMHAARGILTTRGGMTSMRLWLPVAWAALCGWGRSIRLIWRPKSWLPVVSKLWGRFIDDWWNQRSGNRGRVPTFYSPSCPAISQRFMGWADSLRLKVRAKMRRLRLMRVLPVILEQRDQVVPDQSTCFDLIAFKNSWDDFAEDEGCAADGLESLLPAQQADFWSCSRIMRGVAVTIRLLDPPLRQILAAWKSDIEIFARSARLSIDRVRRRLSKMHESKSDVGNLVVVWVRDLSEIYGLSDCDFEAALPGDVMPPEIIFSFDCHSCWSFCRLKMVDDVCWSLYDHGW